MTGIVRLDPALVAGEPQVVEGPALTRTQDDRVRKFYVIRERC
jgi:hypothetical protein